MQTRSKLKTNQNPANVVPDKKQESEKKSRKRKRASESHVDVGAQQKQDSGKQTRKQGKGSYADVRASQKQDSGKKAPKQKTASRSQKSDGRKQRTELLSNIAKPDVEREDLKGKVMINRAPVLTLWVAVVAEREGYRYEEGLSFGKWIAGILAHSKGRRLGLYEDADKEEKEERKRKRKEVERFEVFGMKVPGKVTEGGIRLALQDDKVIHPPSVQAYLLKAFGSDYERVKVALRLLAKAHSPKIIGKEAYSLYEKFRPWVQHGIHGWGAKGALNLDVLQDLMKQAIAENT